MTIFISGRTIPVMDTGKAVKMNLTKGPREKAYTNCCFKFCHVICSGPIWPSESISSPLPFHRVINWRDNLLDLYTMSDSLRLTCVAFITAKSRLH